MICLLATLLLFCHAPVIAQPGKLPPFRVMQADGKVYKAENLPIGKPIVLLYFSPDCDHCEKFMNEFFKKTDAFKKASVVMITYLPIEKVAQFGRDYQVQRFANIIVGTEGMTFFVRNYYKLMEMPFAALHDKNGNLIKSYTRDIPLQDLSNLLNRLK